MTNFINRDQNTGQAKTRNGIEGETKQIYSAVVKTLYKPRDQEEEEERGGGSNLW